MGGTALGASGRSNNGLKLDVKTGKLSLWRLFPTFTFTFQVEQRAPRRELGVQPGGAALSLLLCNLMTGSAMEAVLMPVTAGERLCKISSGN